MKLLINALTKFTCGLLLVGALIFWPAGTLAFSKGWLLIALLGMAVFALAVTAAVLILKKKK